MNRSWDSGIRGLKQIHKAMLKNGIGNFEKYTEMFLERQGFFSWAHKVQK